MDEASGKRALFELIIPKIAVLAGIPQESSYEDISISVLEILADASNVERFKVYKIPDIINEITEGRIKADAANRNDIPRFLLKKDVFSRLIKNRILDALADELSDELSDAE